MKDFVNKLREKSVLVTPTDIHSQVEQMLNEIIKNDQVNGRDKGTLVRHVSNGCILEAGIAKLLGAVINRKVHNSKDPSTFAYDLEVDGIKIEVKPSPPRDKWFNFNLNDVENFSEEQLLRANLSTFLKYIHYTDFIIVAYYVKEGTGWRVYPKWIMESGNFKTFVKRSNPNGKGTTNYYHITNAIKVGDCFPLY